MTDAKVGRIVWHDLLTPDESASKAFYASVAGWSYLTEHATNFAWGGGEKDFVLAVLDGEAGAGLLSQRQVAVEGWIPYVEVEDIDRAAQLATEVGGSVIKPPFEVPGVGSNSLLRDPLGAAIGIAVSQHDYPIPTAQFAPERYLMGQNEFPVEFYRDMFGWRHLPSYGTVASLHAITIAEDVLAICTADQPVLDDVAMWVPGIRVESLAKALCEVPLCNGVVLNENAPTPDLHKNAIVRDPTEALSYLVEV